MDQERVRTWLEQHFKQAEWSRGVARDELVDVAQNDPTICRLFEQTGGDRLYRSVDDVMRAIPAQAWQQPRRAAEARAEAGELVDTPSHFQEGPVGQDRSGIYRTGDPTPPPTPGFGQSAGAKEEAGQPG